MQLIHTPAIRALALACAALALWPRQAAAQAGATLTPMPRAQFFDSSGRPLAGGCVGSFQAGSTTPLATYNNASASVANPNPLQLDASGRGDIWLGPQAYKITVRAATAGCIVPGAILYTTDGILDQGFSLARSLALGTLAIGLRPSPVTGAGGGVGPGNALLSATTAGLYVSVNGAAPALLATGGGAGSPGAPTNSVQYNNGGSFGGSANLLWDNPGAVMKICPVTAAACTINSGFQAPTFSSSATGTNPAFETAGGTFQLNGNGDALFQNVSVTKTFNSLATGTDSAIQQVSGTFRITGDGNGLFQNLSVTQTFNSLATGATSAVQQASGTFRITGNGDGFFQNMSVTSTFNSLATGTTSAIQQVGGTFRITGAGAAFFQSIGVTTSTPATSAATGTAGTIAWDSGFIYVCVAANTWKRVAIATW